MTLRKPKLQGKRVGFFIGVAAYLCLCASMLFVACQGYSGDRVLVLPGRGDSHDFYLYWIEHPLLCFLVATVWLVLALLLLAGLVTLVVMKKNKGGE